MCMMASSSKMVETPGGSIPLSLEPIMVELEGVCYISPILPISLAYLVGGRRSAVRVTTICGGGGSNRRGGCGDGGGGSRIRRGSGGKKFTTKVGTTGGGLHK